MTFAIARQRPDGKLSFFSAGEFYKDKRLATTWITRSEAVIEARDFGRPTIVLDLGSDVLPTGDGDYCLGASEEFVVRVNGEK